MKHRTIIILTAIFSIAIFRSPWFNGTVTIQPAWGGTGDEIDYRYEMEQFVAAIAARARAKNPKFGIFAQNASELGTDPDYVSVLTGIGQEDLYYGYNRDGQATPSWITQELETNLDCFKASGKLVLSVDYPFKNRNTPKFDSKSIRKIDKAYQKSLSKGYVPYATVRNLNYLVVNPGHEPLPNEPPITDWNQVTEWAYQLQPSWDQKRVSFLHDLGDSKFDLIVIDYSFDGSEDTEFTPVEITSLKNSLKGKVISYLSIGEAEDYRWYWQDEWDANHDGKPDLSAPEWLDIENLDWPGNYKVHYWDSGWQEIIFAYLDKILAQGFDGAYLDLIDVYEYYEGQ